MSWVAEAWPPLLAAGDEPAVGIPGIQPAMLRTIERTDGTTQGTCSGHALGG